MAVAYLCFFDGQRASLTCMQHARCHHQSDHNHNHNHQFGVLKPRQKTRANVLIIAAVRWSRGSASTLCSTGALFMSAGSVSDGAGVVPDAWRLLSTCSTTVHSHPGSAHLHMNMHQQHEKKH
jgi:hypothetical protein